jgi:hypothetical protein
MLENAQYPRPTQIVLFPPSHRTARHLISTPVNTLKGSDKILVALAEFDYLTSFQVTRLRYAPSSLAFVRKKLRSLVTAGLVLALGGRAVNLPLIYTLSSKGRTYAEMLGEPSRKRFRPTEEWDKAENLFFMRHTLAVNDVLIAARLLSQTVPGITVHRMYRERELRRTIYVALPERSNGGSSRNICIEPDASVEFEIYEDWHEQTWQDFFHIEVYRHLLLEARFKQKVKGYMVYAMTGQHEALFHASALSIVVFTATDQQAATLKRWTEEAFHDQPELGEYFFFRSIDTGSASPTEIFLSPVWQQAFSSTAIPLLVIKDEQLKEGHAQ